jgi:hypothetical protein|tara:strand:+ start:2705 stop:3019 length:315 start_codon:yes stop_codon:yes gene_type:complete
MALEDVGIEPPNEEARKMIFNPSEEMQTVLMTRLAEMTEEELNALDEAITPKVMNVLMKFLPELEILISRIAEVREQPEQEEAKPMEQNEMPPEETMGALKDIA